MATRTLHSNDGDDRLIISTICTHLFAFHEAGFEYRTQRKRAKVFVVWNPLTWGGGFEWVDNSNTVQPLISEYAFFQGAGVHRNPYDFAVSETRGRGRFKSSCIFVGVGVSGDRQGPTGVNTGGFNALGNDARSVNDVLVRFDYDGESRSLRHSG